MIVSCRRHRCVSISDKGGHLGFWTTALFLGPEFAGSGILPYHRWHGLCWCVGVLYTLDACSGRNITTASSSEWHHSTVSISLTRLTRMLCFAPQATNHSTTRGPQLGRTKTDLPDGPFQSSHVICQGTHGRPKLNKYTEVRRELELPDSRLVQVCTYILWLVCDMYV